jgi:hypothetical protein
MDSRWVKGSSIQILPDRAQGMSDNYQADRITVSATSGNNAAQTLSQLIEIDPDPVFPTDSRLFLTCTLYLRLVDGQFGSSDVFRVSGERVVAVAETPLSALNNRLGLWTPLTLTVEVEWNEDFDVSIPEYTFASLLLEFFCERSVSLDWGGAQVEFGRERTSFIELGANSIGRDADSLIYAVNPIAGLTSWAVYCSLDEWRGDGQILEMGNLSLTNVGTNLVVTYGSFSVTLNGALGASPRIAVAGLSEQNRLQVYIDGILRSSNNLQGYVPGAGRVRVGGDGMRWYRCAYAFNRGLSDGTPALNQPVSEELQTLFNRDILFLLPPSDPTVISLAPVHLRGRGGRAILKLPFLKSAGQAISSPTAGGGTAQVRTVTVATIVAADAVQVDWIRVNQTVFRVFSDATPTVNEIATLLRSAVNATPKAEPVTASGSDAAVTLTADSAGNPFHLECSPNLLISTTTENKAGSHTVVVPNAADYVRGRCFFLRDGVFVAEGAITAINTSTNVITVETAQRQQFLLVRAGDELVQPSWETLIGQGNYLVTGKNQYPFVEIESKELDRFTIANCDWNDVWVDFSVRVGL